MEAYVAGRTDNLHDYLIPTIGDVPEIECLLVEDAEPAGPFGAKGVGEPALIPTAPAILGAIRDATGRPDGSRAGDAGPRARGDQSISNTTVTVAWTSCVPGWTGVADSRTAPAAP